MGQDDGVNRSALPLAAVPLKYNQARGAQPQVSGNGPRLK